MSTFDRESNRVNSLCGFNLESHLFGTLVVPQVYVDTKSLNVPNPDYVKFSQILYSSLDSWFLASI